MQNDVLKNNIAPWQEKGRWYHANIYSSSSVSGINTNRTDSFIVDNFNIYPISGKIYIGPKVGSENIVILDCHANYKNYTISTDATNVTLKYYAADGRILWGFAGGPFTGADIDLWLFVIEN